jgi:YtkA-like
MKKLALALFVAAVLAPAASAGGWATVGVSTLPPEGLQAGQAWAFDMTVLQHGRTPLEGIQPIVRLRGPDGVVEEFAAKPTKKPGVYHAVVTFPSNGTWSYEIWDDFSQTHTFKPIMIGAPSPASTASDFPTLLGAGIALALLLALTAATTVAVYLRRRRPAPEPAEVIDLKEAA